MFFRHHYGPANCNLAWHTKLLENLEYHFEHVNWEEKQKLLKILFPEKLIFKNGQYINPSKDGISLLVEDIKEFEKEGASGQAGSKDMKVVKKLGRVTING